MSISSGISYLKDKPREFQVWKDYPHFASKPGGLKKGSDKLLIIGKLIKLVQYLVFSIFHTPQIIPQ